MRIFLVIFLAISFNSTSAQEMAVIGNDPCSKRIYIDTRFFKDYPYLNYPDFLRNFVKSEYPDAINYILYDDGRLIEIPRIWCVEGSARFYGENPKYNTIEIEITEEEFELDIDVEQIEAEPLGFLPFELEKKLGYNYYGRVEKMKTKVKIKRLDKIVCKTKKDTFIIEKKFIRDLFGPSTCFQYSSSKSIHAYYDSAKKSVYIYINGYNSDEYARKADLRNTYAAKIIIDLSAKSVHRIVIPGKYLWTYGWLACLDFWVM